MAWTKEAVVTTEGFDKEPVTTSENWTEAGIYQFRDEKFNKLNEYKFDEAHYNMLGYLESWSEN